MERVRDRWVVISLFAIAMQLFVFRRFGGFGNVLFLGALWSLTVGLFGSFRKIGTRSIESYITLFAALLAIITLSVDGPFRVFLTGAGAIISLIYAAYALMRGYAPKGMLETFLSIPQTIGAYFTSGFSVVSGPIASGHTRTSSSHSHPLPTSLKSYFVGFVIGLPIVIWIISLLSSADPVFSSFIQHLISKEILQQLPVRVFVTVFAFLVLVPTVFMKLNKLYVSPLAFFQRGKYDREMSTILVMVTTVLTLFLGVQWPYVFAHVAEERSLAQFGVATYSEYVQKGFGELVMVAAIVTALSWFTWLIYRGIMDKKSARILKGLQLILGVEFIIFVASIMRRVILYTQFHGLSLARLYGLAFLIWIIGMAIQLGGRYLTRRNLFAYEFGWTILIFVATISINMQKLVLVNPPTVNNRIDYVYLSKLSADGYDGWTQSYRFAREVIMQEKGKQGILVQDERRDLEYARLILDMIRNHYAELGVVYGDDEDVAHAADWNQYMGRTLMPLDRIYSWNAQQQYAFRKLKQDIPYAELVSLQNDVVLLKKRIESQPKSEQDYTIDISYDTPLL